MLRTHDALTKVFLFLIVLLLAAHLLIIAGPVNPPAARAAGIPDSGAQLENVVDQLKELNKRVDSVQKYLESGNLSVKVKSDKEEK